MAKPIYTPRVNNNDDQVQIIGLAVAVGDRVEPGQVLAEVETDKSIAEVESDQEGYVLDILHPLDAHAPVGSVLMWIGETRDEPVPEPVETAPEAAAIATGRPTAKARMLLRRHGLSADRVPASGERLSAADVEAWLARQGTAGAAAARPAATLPAPEVPGEAVPLSAEEQGMVHTVTWHRDQAVAAYLERPYDAAVWEQAAADYARRQGLMLSPLLSLMAYRLVELARERPKINATLVGGQRYQYAPVNLGFTVQAGDTLYLTVVRDAGALDLGGFIDALGQVQRHAMGHKLRPEETQGATLGFSSMARWGVARHIPVLPPHTALMVAHAATGPDGRAILGASYDHRVLSGFDVARLLQDLAKPPAFA